jgi:hypothetical protein
MIAGGISVSGLESARGRFGRLEFVSLLAALVWGAGLIIAAFLVPVYQSSTVSVSGAVSTGSATLVAVNGSGVLAVAGLPLVAAVLTGVALWRRAGRSGAGVFAWIVIGLLACFNVLAILSVGLLVIPVTVALAVACGTHGRQARAASA